MTSPTRPEDALDLFGEPAARERRPRRRRGSVIAGAVAATVLIGAGGAYATNAATAELPAASAVTLEPVSRTFAAPALAWPAYGSGAVAAVGLDGTEEDGLLARYGSTDTLPTGSIAKVVTALVVLAAKPIAVGTDGETITFTGADVQYYAETLAESGSNAPVTAGLQLSERQALTAMMLPSANNYAKSLAIWAYGSEEAFLAAARSWLDGQGFARTSLADASGLSPATVSTTAEMVRLGELLIADPVLAPIVAMPTADIPGVGELANTNSLLGRSGVDGIKTGTTDEAGSCLLFSLDASVEGQPVTLVGVVVGARTHPQLADDVLTLIPSIEAGFRSVPLTTEGQDYGSLTSAWGEKVAAETAQAQSVLVWGAASTSTSVVLDPVETVADGERVGTATVVVNGTSYELPVVVDGTIEDPGFGWRLAHPAELFG
ncbi:D-alanyl-D-alanine carboxypeptidase family protein [Rathayibacter rathayi]|uniref:D-alanyl-D-alanine carboxypeptidase n=1 Tax=Rathayibacter rathayi TaxID=33887 RepID=A0ABD6WBL5_RATRA|nr:serine hydrolase [Rathayibacter rathayi]AZZ48760.1 D-alanyl-D-alanine carboxypeptidase [Rathayibacter rathayi]MWV73843.1 D-alanyl-D-alanine carboxypeptidase [Rathayibacter rathayi NCPPB 2980 = VKM Ac-1601]PPF15709.1 D-alanyl-D-alanine carboxypeptidase [Rathayibacter rathayi]PPF25367.1 D-alanyl-D-alanine carboxypeptidase [Rathayibacter rathayi]PPF50796.1 D-alanyl-D-alanine carboxypeptidase [Rathayibacter rathayi]